METEKRKPRILITNDDGIHAPGIRALWNALKDFAEIIIVAPSTERSGAGLSITVHHPLRLDRVDWGEGVEAWSATGTPADCVKLALTFCYSTPPDLIVSGINRGSNAGRNILYSGTVGGVIEGIMHDIPGIAFSCHSFHRPNYKEAEEYILPIVQHVLETALPHGTLLNVNFPDTYERAIAGMKMTRQGRGMWVENPDRRSHPADDHYYYWIGLKPCAVEEIPDSDTAFLEQGFITAVPVHVAELTDHHQILVRKDSFEKIFDNLSSFSLEP